MRVPASSPPVVPAVSTPGAAKRAKVAPKCKTPAAAPAPQHDETARPFSLYLRHMLAALAAQISDRLAGFIQRNLGGERALWAQVCDAGELLAALLLSKLDALRLYLMAAEKPESHVAARAR